ncbi:MAG: hypothetical protein AAF612_05460 [Planctomycetota bacterium]
MTRQPLSRIRRIATVSTLGLAAVAATGCGVSKDIYTITSTYHTPHSVAIVDTRTGDAVWEYDVLIGQELEIDLQHDDGDNGFQGSDTMASSMDWELSEIGGSTLESDSVEFPEGIDPRVDITVRPAGNNPGEEDLTLGG